MAANIANLAILLFDYLINKRVLETALRAACGVPPATVARYAARRLISHVDFLVGIPMSNHILSVRVFRNVYCCPMRLFSLHFPA